MATLRYNSQTGEYGMLDESTGQIEIIPEHVATMNPVEAGFVAGGKTLTEVGRGAQDLFYRMTGNDQARAELQQRQIDENQLYAPLTARHPMATTVGEAAPHLATAVVPGGLVAQAAMGAGASALEYDPYSSAEGRGATGAAATVAGNVVGRVLGTTARAMGQRFRPTAQATGSLDVVGNTGQRSAQVAEQEYADQVARGVSPDLSATEMRLLDKGDRLGMQSPPGVATGDTGTKLMESSLRSNPLTGAQLRAVQRQNQKAINQQVAGSLGIKGDRITDTDLGRISDNFKTGYDNIADRIGKFQIGDDTIDQLADFEQMVVNNRNLLPDTSSRLKKLAGDVLDRADDNLQLDAKKIMAYRSNAQKAAKQAWRQGDELSGELYDEFGAILDDMMEQSASGKTLADLKRLNRQWRLFKAVESNAIDPVSGNIRPLQMNRNLMRMDKGGYMRGRNQSDVYESIRYGAMNKDIVGDSGTATRSWSQVTGNPVYDAAINLTVDPLARMANRMPGTGSAPGRIGGAAARGLLAAPDYIALEQE